MREWRMVVERHDGYRQSYPKRDKDHAAQGVKDFIRDQKRSPFWSGAMVTVEHRDVSEWMPVGLFDDI